ncbi:helix-turn-helix domain-containing protein [Mycobacteroides salmoniphilum]|uniref:Nucleoid-associated protein EspR n=1 Tax=Mycobacteroides salmoniphilum TaxID=404941 RepID=A0A4R8SZX7_9MYCO|nr:helix-turn-helix domain-containing protein [Mycobacteroides salmoniphilum]TEA09187.1 Nucleoid-associated protein EspR [Mycobacteroides salmoniphilum]
MVSFAEKLNTLIEKSGKGWMSKPQLAKAITEATGIEMDDNYMWKLCKGKVPDPRLTTVEQLATYFGVKASYFTDSSNDEAHTAVLDLLETMRNAKVENIGMRTADLSPSALSMIGAAVNRAIDNARELEGLDPVPGPDEENHDR